MRLRDDLEAQVTNYNMRLAGGKWSRIMLGLVTGKPFDHWNSQVRWPWGDKPETPVAPVAVPPPTAHPAARPWRAAAVQDNYVTLRCHCRV